ncbi:Hint domain-containing protein [Shimia haliotis]|uniref:VCBS repeat-containing protein n=1 Tax=Shimia haliotis TaxID=1280847 RepID=A0A1I4FZ59_9RHOB|nr:Hint domain-containing protein [Shimia haliotis]SFL22021.1 VCBS repeat-containing protein [Shimia haliotis]
MGIPVPDTGSVTEDSGVVGGFLSTSGDVDYWFGNDTGAWTAETIAGAYGGALVIDDDGVWTYTALNDHPAIAALNDGETLTEVFTVTSAGGTTTITITINGTTDPPCFVAGTLIDTPSGPRAVETLQIGDLVLTRDAGPQRIRWVGQSTVDTRCGDTPDALRPIRIRAHSLGQGVPDRDLLISPLHRILLTGSQAALMFGASEVLCAARHLVNGTHITQAPAGLVRYVHLFFDCHQIVTGNGLQSESFFPGKVGLDRFEEHTREELFQLFPELRTLPESYGQPARRILRGYEGRLMRLANTPR